MNLLKLKSTQNRIKQVKAYDKLPEFYDHMMRHVNYAEWAEYIDLCFRRFGYQIRKIVDGGFGTGSLIKCISGYGYDVLGFDHSIGMTGKARDKGLNRIWQGSLRSIPLASGSVDGVLCLYDTSLYLDAAEQLEFFAEAYRILRDNGVLIIDTVTESHIRDHWFNHTDYDHNRIFRLKRVCRYDEDKRMQYTDITLRSAKEKQEYFENHIQHIYPLWQIVSRILNKGFRIAGCFDEFSFRTAGEFSGRVHIVAVKEGP